MCRPRADRLTSLSTGNLLKIETSLFRDVLNPSDRFLLPSIDVIEEDGRGQSLGIDIVEKLLTLENDFVELLTKDISMLIGVLGTERL